MYSEEWFGRYPAKWNSGEKPTHGEQSADPLRVPRR